jgi:hypothetical protein
MYRMSIFVLTATHIIRFPKTSSLGLPTLLYSVTLTMKPRVRCEFPYLGWEYGIYWYPGSTWRDRMIEVDYDVRGVEGQAQLQKVPWSWTWHRSGDAGVRSWEHIVRGDLDVVKSWPEIVVHMLWEERKTHVRPRGTVQRINKYAAEESDSIHI